jgi:hypothetical protein
VYLRNTLCAGISGRRKVLPATSFFSGQNTFLQYFGADMMQYLQFILCVTDRILQNP